VNCFEAVCRPDLEAQIGVNNESDSRKTKKSTLFKRSYLLECLVRSVIGITRLFPSQPVAETMPSKLNSKSIRAASCNPAKCAEIPIHLPSLQQLDVTQLASFGHGPP